MRKRALLVAVALLVAALGLTLTPAAVRLAWRWRSSNPVRRGIATAERLGCFSCHGPLGAEGLPDPGPSGHEVPGWTGTAWSRYVEDPVEVRQYILDGLSQRRSQSETARKQRERSSILMPAYREFLRGSDLEDLTAAFLVLSGMRRPSDGSAAARGREVAERWRCFSCHGAGGSGGRPNPGSYTGFVPGWYGPDFTDLVRDREEFEEWVREGNLARLERRGLAAWFGRRQRLRMPSYRRIGDGEMDDLWAYVRWLGETGGGISPPHR